MLKAIKKWWCNLGATTPTAMKVEAESLEGFFDPVPPRFRASINAPKISIIAKPVGTETVEVSRESIMEGIQSFKDKWLNEDSICKEVLDVHLNIRTNLEKGKDYAFSRNFDKNQFDVDLKHLVCTRLNENGIRAYTTLGSIKVRLDEGAYK